MSKRGFLNSLALGLLSGIFCLSAYAEPKFSWGPYLRLRHEYWKNYKDMDNDQMDNRNFFRVKSSLWGKADLDENLVFYAKLTNEFKSYTYWAGASGDKSATKKGYHFDINEVVFDGLYMDVNNFFDLPLDLRLGRQDLSYAEGFLLSDGTPQDGSRTNYFNAAKATWQADDKNSVDFIYINDPRDEEFLPVINRRRLINLSNRLNDRVPQALNNSDETAGVLYWKNNSIKDLSLEPYYIYKKEAQEGTVSAGKPQDVASTATTLNTFGSYVKRNLGTWTLRGQAAYQFGDYGDNDRTGIGGYTYADKDFKNALWKPKATAGYIYLSGDNRKTDKNEGWDPLFSRATWFSDLYSLSMSAETGLSYYWTNLQAYRAGVALKPAGKVNLSFWYTFMLANSQVPADAVFSGKGKTRGQLTQAKVEYAFNKNVSTYFLADYFFPGNFYKDRDQAIFLRTQLEVKF